MTGLHLMGEGGTWGSVQPPKLIAWDMTTNWLGLRMQSKIPFLGTSVLKILQGRMPFDPPSYRWQPLVVCILSPLLLNPESAPAWWVKRTGVHPQHSMCVVPFDISVLTDNISITVVNSFCSNSFHSPVKCHSHRHMMHYHVYMYCKKTSLLQKKNCNYQ